MKELQTSRWKSDTKRQEYKMIAHEKEKRIRNGTPTHTCIYILNLQRAAPYIQFYIQQNGERHKRENEDERFYLKKEKNKEERKKSEEKRIR